MQNELNTLSRNQHNQSPPDHSQDTSQGFSLHVRKSLIFIKRSDEWIDIALIIGDKSGSRALWACFFPQSQDYAAEQGQIGCGVACAASALVFKEGGISGVMVFIFDIPSESDVLCGLS